MFYADLHIHSKFSRATSKDMSLETIEQWAQLKGIKLIGTGDFTHPQWLKEIELKLNEEGNGLLTLKKEYRLDVPDSCKEEIFFILSSEISCIYQKNGKLRKIHLVILSPSLKDATKINYALSQIGSLGSDGRPILGIDAKEAMKIILEISPATMIIPAHAWTPHFSVFGSQSGFDSLEECFEDLTPYIYAIETGLSSDPPMNWRLSELDKISLISNSDAHSPAKIGREANIFDIELDYKTITESIKTGKGFLGTVEFFPEEGKYHYDGHRICGVRLSPKESIRRNYLCPVCGKKVTIGVMHRVETLADRPEGFKPSKTLPFKSIIPLPEIIAEIKNTSTQSKSVFDTYMKILYKFGSEYAILLHKDLTEIEKFDSKLAEGIDRMRSGKVFVEAGYDGEYGKIKVFGEPAKSNFKGQTILF
ncbi:MAG: endonuclease Q family protein [Thermodesulfovibrio sp.]|uniref:endonuclease Q family protein n=1 Tax=unclassified Thermodesulfovibrio TaxID=2645936 RepID=UPI00083A3AF7|nr:MULTISPECIES: endonuclease Q family protein [unclassified Thermodesulfovibrio]MDI1471995.1 endonuclease Q family protein [Thermodesulfovibrio sp. 1176]MDI6715212.1 endonuclease Q family protein [Thermodesulfovibrio sp.]ODA45248.1 ATP-dependent DNA helicase UvrD/PcrA [Thermodesulfovibrio sp. N1]